MLRNAFQEFGQVKSVKIIKDRITGAPRGFAFVEMSKPEEGQAAIAKMNGSKLEGKTLVVDEAKERDDSRPARPMNKGNYSTGGGFSGNRRNNNRY